MKYRHMPSIVSVIEMAHVNSKYNTKKSSINKKWTRFLKNNKLFDEYMIYLGGDNAIGVEPNSYKELSNICHNLSGRKYEVKGSYGKYVEVDWNKIFREFMSQTIKWYNIKERFLYAINKGYE